MTRVPSLLPGIAAALLFIGLGTGSASALVVEGTIAQDQTRSDQGEARREMRAGRILSIREIERRILPRMQGYEYLTFDYDRTTMAYRLKFIRDGRVTYVDVDARTARIINRSN